MIPGTHTAHLSQWSLRVSAFKNDDQQVFIAYLLGYAQHVHLPFNPLSNPRADAIRTLILQIEQGITEMKSFGQGDP